MHHNRALAFACVSALSISSAVTAHASAEAMQSGTWSSHHENVLGTSLDLTIRATSKAQAARAERALLAEFDRQSSILSAWDAHSEFSAWQKTRGVASPVSPELLTALARFDLWQRKTGSLLNAASQDASLLWRAAAVSAKAPDAEKLQASVDRMAQLQWQLDAVRGTATRLTDTPLVLATFTKARIINAAADVALRSGATGVMINVGGDILTRGAMVQRVDIANPDADAESSPALDTILLRGRTIATSGGYRRNVTVGAEQISHLIDPRTAMPASQVLSASVVSADSEEAGALATALAIASPNEARGLLKEHASADALILYRSGERLQTSGWARLQEPRLQQAVYHDPPRATGGAAAAAAWNQNFDLTIKLNLPRIDDPRYRRPFVAVWIEDENKYPVRTIALWFDKPRWLPDLKTWYRDDRLRNLTEGTDIAPTVSSATRAPGAYTLKWDGKDNEGKLVKPGKYTVCAEASREHGGYGLSRYEIDFNGKPQQADLPQQPEIGAVQLVYAKK